MNPIIEHDRLVVKMASWVRQHPDVKLYPVCDETTIFLAFEGPQHGQAQWQVISAMDWWYSAFARTCFDRATRAEDGQLLPGGKRLKAETYLKLWRDAGERAISFDQRLDRGLTLVVTITRPAAFIQDILAGRRSIPEAAPYLQSPNIVRADVHEIVWAIPLTDVNSVLEYIAIDRLYVPSDDYPGERTPTFFTVRVSANSCARPPAAQFQSTEQVSLFSEAA